MWFQSAQNLAQISDLQAQLEEALKEKQEVQEKVGFWHKTTNYSLSQKSPEQGIIINLRKIPRGGIPSPRMDRRAMHVTCTEHVNVTRTIID